MIRVYRCMQRYALDKSAMMARSKCFYPESKPYCEDTIHYAYNLALHPGNVYEGVADICFKLQKKGDLFMDFHGKTVKQIIINSSKVSPSEVHKEGKIDLPSKLLKEGFNNVSVRYENQYDKDGSGCVSFVDVDKKQYLYTQFEPYMGNRVFPMFDQPDLKAKMNLSIACPSQWEAVLSNEDLNTKSPNFVLGSSVCNITKALLDKFQQQIPSGYKISNFYTTKLLPTYLFCFVVGPYKKYVSKNTYKNIPMNLYCIQSLYPYMMKLVPFIQQMTNKSMEFFQKYFRYPYPFSKYDQVFAHEYKWGAMQNAGIVTLNDLYIFKDPVSTEKMISFGNTIVHQMAHHWFGNLVTMKWWDDLWLNESFAQYISHYCLQKIKSEVKTINYESAMASFLNRKGWGYSQDQLVTTHPIRTDVQNTQVAESIFDGITYSKGAATMKQLMYLMGEQAFSKALGQYFHSFQFKNAELADLLKFMAKHYRSKGNLTIDQWRQMWLEKAGLNILSSEFDSKNSVLKIKQTPYHQNHSTLRSHTIKIALVQSPKNIEQIQVVVQPKEITEIKLSASEAQKFKYAKAVILNYQDLTFCKVILDQKSISYLKTHLNQIDDVLLRSMVWKNFFDLVKDAHLKSTEYIQILAQNLMQEKSDAIIEQNLNYAITAIQKYMPSQYRPKYLQTMLTKCLGNIESADKNRSIIIRDKIISFSSPQNETDIRRLIDWYWEKGNNKLLAPNNTQRWRILIKVLSSKSITRQEKITLLEDMVKRDSSDTMKNKKLTCNALLLQENETEAFFKKITENSSQNWGMTTFIHSIAGLNNRIHQESLRKSLKVKYFSAVKTSLQSKDHSLSVLKKSQFIQLFIDHMDPIIQDTTFDLKQKMEILQKIEVKNNDKIRIQLMKKVDLLRKRIRCFNLF